MAEFMASSDNYTKAYAEALIIGMPPDQLVATGHSKSIRGMSPEEIARLEKKMAPLERDYRLHQEQFGENSVHLSAAHRYPELLQGFEELIALESL